jgi:hypothetical protein
MRYHDGERYAVALAEDTVGRRRQVLGEDHADTLGPPTPSRPCWMPPDITSRRSSWQKTSSTGGIEHSAKTT